MALGLMLSPCVSAGVVNGVLSQWNLQVDECEDEQLDLAAVVNVAMFGVEIVAGLLITAALGALATAIEAEMAQAHTLPDVLQRSRALLAAVGRGYLGFAQTETGWFRTAIASVEYDVDLPPDTTRAAAMGLNPFELLGYALDSMAEAGAKLIVLAGVPFGTPGATNLLHVVTVSGDELDKHAR